MSLDKYKGLLWGAALGDAIGAPYECKHGSLSYKDEIVESASLPLGSITDDTEMIIALGRALVENKGIWIKENVVIEYCKWASGDPADIGINTKMLFRHITMYPQKYNKMYDATYKAYILDKPQKYWSQSNGCLMRCSILALCKNDSKNKEVWVEDCKLSNPHPVCIEACELYSRCIEGLVSCDYTVIDNYRSFNSCINDVVQSVLRREKRDVSNNRGWVCHGLYFALWMYKWNDFDTFEDGMKWVIGEHLDSDTDTNACIAGSILGMKLGFEKMIRSSVTKKNYEIVLRCKTSRPYKAEEINKFIEILTK